MRSLAKKYIKNQNKNSWGEIRTLDLTDSAEQKVTKCHVLREGAVRSLTKKYIKNQNKNSWGEIRTLDLTGMSRALSPTELPSQGFSSLFNCQWLSCFERCSHKLLYCSLRSRELPSQGFFKIYLIIYPLSCFSTCPSRRLLFSHKSFLISSTFYWDMYTSLH